MARLGATLLALAPTEPGAYLAWAAYRENRREAAADTDAKVRTLAALVAAAETRQRAQLIGPGAHCINVAFHQRTEPANNATGAAAHRDGTGRHRARRHGTAPRATALGGSAPGGPVSRAPGGG
ncbi:hypothetical protein ABZV34_30600 [Streptomyces sp. NPDC005195]|uniref:hypothetical protein n=1 Tax=Streptomyces sp. NPDC005195 TaxID=3154561 RepID=UPI0033B3DAE4